MSRVERWTLFVTFFLVALLATRILRAQDDETTLLLAQAMVAEADWSAPLDHAAIAHAMKRKAERVGIPLADMLVRYVAIFRVESPRQRWVTTLNLEATEPDGWPPSLSWPAHVDRWRAVIARARSFMAGTLPDPCGDAVEHWGGVRAGDVPRGRMVIAKCSALTSNTFFALRPR